MNFYTDQGRPLDISTVAFYKARMNYNPNAPGSLNPVMASVSILYDCISKLVIGTIIGPYESSERDAATHHLHALKETLRQSTITVFDRGYFSLRLIHQLVQDGQKFIMRMDHQNLKRYSSQLSTGQDQTFDVTFTRSQSNHYRKDRVFRATLMSTVYPLRFVKIPLRPQEEEVLLTNLTPEEFSAEGLKEVYRLRWGIESAYNVLKNRMKLEEFSGIRERLILQDIYCTVWLYNLTMLHLMDVSATSAILQERYKHEMKRNLCWNFS